MYLDAIKVFELRKSFSRGKVLRGVSFCVSKGSVLAIIGPSGSGKTTLLKCINLLLPIDGGQIVLHGETIAEFDGKTGQLQIRVEPSIVRKKVGMVFQEWNLWPNKTVRGNIAEGPRFVLGQSKSDASSLAEELCAKVRLSEKLDAYPEELSGGQKQRAAIARALAMNPEVLMLDEVTSALDPSLVGEVLDVISGLKSEQQTLLIVTHHMEFAKAVADEVAFLWRGKIHEFGPAKETLENPKTLELRSFLKTLERTH